MQELYRMRTSYNLKHNFWRGKNINLSFHSEIIFGYFIYATLKYNAARIWILDKITVWNQAMYQKRYDKVFNITFQFSVIRFIRTAGLYRYIGNTTTLKQDINNSEL